MQQMLHRRVPPPREEAFDCWDTVRYNDASE